MFRMADQLRALLVNIVLNRQTGPAQLKKPRRGGRGSSKVDYLISVAAAEQAPAGSPRRRYKATLIAAIVSAVTVAITVIASTDEEASGAEMSVMPTAAMEATTVETTMPTVPTKGRRGSRRQRREAQRSCGKCNKREFA